MKIVIDTSAKTVALDAVTLRSYGDYIEMIEGVVAQVALLWPEEHRAYIESGEDDPDDGEAEDDEKPSTVAPPEKGQQGWVPTDEREANLSPRLKDVLRLYREGLSRQAIADRLRITVGNVDTCKSVLRKLELIP